VFFFTQSLSQLGANAKLDRPLDSHAPQTEYMYHYGDDCGEQDEHEAEDQWEEQDDGYQEEYAYEAYPTEAEEQDPEYDREDQEDDHEQNQGETLEEDDQDTYE
jgi:hypothetical protein